MEKAIDVAPIVRKTAENDDDEDEEDSEMTLTATRFPTSLRVLRAMTFFVLNSAPTRPYADTFPPLRSFSGIHSPWAVSSSLTSAQI
jgi:hypothetical protein